MKAITPVIALVMLLLVTTALVGSASLWFSLLQNSQTSQVFSVISANYGQLTITNLGTSPISNLTAFVDGQQVIVNIPSPIQPSQAGAAYLENLPANFSGDHNVMLAGSSMAIERKINYPVIKVLDIYRCACRISDMVTNFANKNGYPPVQMTCLAESSFSGSYDLSPYNAVVFDGSDCGNSGMSDEAQNNIRNFISAGKGFVVTHDAFLGDKNQILQGVAGVDVTGVCCDSLPPSVQKLVTGKVTEKPYQLPFLMPVQCTHTSGEEKTTSAEVYGNAALRDHYMTTNNYGAGKVVFSQWGHCAYDCGCGLSGGLPGSDEQKSIINSIYWAAGV